MSGVRWQGGKGARIVRWHSRRGGKVIRWQFGKGGRVVSIKDVMVFKEKLCCIAPGKRNLSRYSLQGFDNSYIMFLIIKLTRTLVA